MSCYKGLLICCCGFLARLVAASTTSVGQSVRRGRAGSDNAEFKQITCVTTKQQRLVEAAAAKYHPNKCDGHAKMHSLSVTIYWKAMLLKWKPSPPECAVSASFLCHSRLLYTALQWPECSVSASSISNTLLLSTALQWPE